MGVKGLTQPDSPEVKADRDFDTARSPHSRASAWSASQGVRRGGSKVSDELDGDVTAQSNDADSSADSNMAVVAPMMAGRTSSAAHLAVELARTKQTLYEYVGRWVMTVERMQQLEQELIGECVSTCWYRCSLSQSSAVSMTRCYWSWQLRHGGTRRGCRSHKRRLRVEVLDRKKCCRGCRHARDIEGMTSTCINVF